MHTSLSPRHGHPRDTKSYDWVPQVLLAEDDDDLREMLRDQLLALGVMVSVVADGPALAREIERTRRGQVSFDVVITDIRLPGVSGLDALAAIREADWSTPVVVISAFLGPPETEEALRLGASAVLAKPFEASELLRTLQQLLGSWR